MISALVAACGDASAAPPAATKSTAETPAPAAPPAVVRVVSPEYKTRVTMLETTGKVQFNEEQLVRITAPVTGRVVEVLARPGEVAESGRRLLVIDSPDLGTAKSDYAKAVSDTERAEHAIDLARDLFEAKAIAQKEVRAAENDYRKAVAERERAASRLGTLGVAETQLKEIASRADASTLVVVRAPRSGIIVERNISPGQVVAYGQSDTPLNLFVIADLSSMWVLADVYEPDVPTVHLGQAVAVTLPCCPAERYQGKVVNIGAAVDKDSRTLKVRAVVPNPRRTLKAEMFVRVVIETGASRVLTLPQSAVQRRDGKTFVLVETSPGQYQRRPITPGAEFDGLVEVREGVTPGDRVVAAGGILLRQSGP
ncbi:MAG TPA: efflux RND transporter periplasmic adaptor subunit [Methylomirabilota bacterium]|nr:efflux RND transporter periplasmic adaptor subunit [Methylomirabilota bacterium]